MREVLASLERPHLNQVLANVGLHIAAHSHIFVLRFGQMRVCQHVERYRLTRMEPPPVILVCLRCGRLIHLALSHRSLTLNGHRVLRLPYCGLTVSIIRNNRMSLKDILPGLVQILYIALVDLLLHVFQVLVLIGRRVTLGLISSLCTWNHVGIRLSLMLPTHSILARTAQTGRIRRGVALGIFSTNKSSLLLLSSAIRHLIWRLVSLGDLSPHKQGLLLLNLLGFGQLVDLGRHL